MAHSRAAFGVLWGSQNETHLEVWPFSSRYQPGLSLFFFNITSPFSNGSAGSIRTWVPRSHGVPGYAILAAAAAEVRRPDWYERSTVAAVVASHSCTS